MFKRVSIVIFILTFIALSSTVALAGFVAIQPFDRFGDFMFEETRCPDIINTTLKEQFCYENVTYPNKNIHYFYLRDDSQLDAINLRAIKEKDSQVCDKIKTVFPIDPLINKTSPVQFNYTTRTITITEFYLEDCYEQVKKHKIAGSGGYFCPTVFIDESRTWQYCNSTANAIINSEKLPANPPSTQGANKINTKLLNNGAAMMDIVNRAGISGDPAVCNEINNFFSDPMVLVNKTTVTGYKTSELMFVSEYFIDNCKDLTNTNVTLNLLDESKGETNINSKRSIIFPVPKNIINHDQWYLTLLYVLGILFSVVSCLIIFGFNAKKFIISIGYFFLIVIPIFAVASFFIAGFGGGLALVPAYLLLYYNAFYFSKVLTTSIVTIALLVITYAALMRLLKGDEHVGYNSVVLGIMYTLVIHPFFFPVGPIIGMIYLGYLYIKSKKNALHS